MQCACPLFYIQIAMNFFRSTSSHSTNRYRKHKLKYRGQSGTYSKTAPRLTFHRAFGRLFLYRRDYFFRSVIQFLAGGDLLRLVHQYHQRKDRFLLCSEATFQYDTATRESIRSKENFGSAESWLLKNCIT